MNIRTLRTLTSPAVALLSVGLLSACGDDDNDNNGADAGMTDTSMTDTSMTDTSMTDTSMMDAGNDTTMVDAGEDTTADTTETPGTIPEVAIANGNFTILVDAVVSAGLDDDLAGEGPFTVFAPTDAAFNALPEGTLEGLTTEQLTDILLYHVVADELMAGDVLAESLLPSLLGPFIKVDADATTVGGAAISLTDVEASNGVIHVIDAVMMPPGDIPTVATEAGSFTTLVQAVVDLELDDDLAEEGPFTVFAPTDAAFAALPDGTLESLTAEELTDILLYHVYVGALPAADVLASTELTMLNGDTAMIAMDGGPTIAGAAISGTDIVASNGLIHVIDSVMMPPMPNIPEVAIENGNFTTLVDALVTAGLDDDLAGEGPFTVFAPTDAAFAALPDGTLEGLSTDELTDILLYHVVADSLMASDVLAESVIPSLLGTFIKVDAEATTVADAPISMTNIEASNGVIHVIDAVMLPPASIPVLASESDNFTTLVQAVVDLDLDDDLAADGPLTVFAPTDAAFAALPDGTLESLTDEQLTDILLYHVYNGALPAADVLASTELTMLNGDTATIAMDGGTPTIDGAPISATDVVAGNGLIHVLDAVMLPPSE